MKAVSVALNPTDFKHLDIVGPRGTVIGNDYAGIVVKLGQHVPVNWKVGDRVTGLSHGGLYQDQVSFAEDLKTPGDIAFEIPEGRSFQEATTYGVSAARQCWL